MTAPVWRCYYCGREVVCDTDGSPMDWENEEGDAGPLLARAICEDWPKCERIESGASEVLAEQTSDAVDNPVETQRMGEEDIEGPPTQCPKCFSLDGWHAMHCPRGV